MTTGRSAINTCCGAELEAYAIKQLADAGDLAPLLQTLKACRAQLEAAYKAHDPRAYLMEIRRFYDAIAAYTGNRPLCNALARLNETAEPLRYNLLSRRLEESRTRQYMLRIIQAVEAGRFRGCGGAQARARIDEPAQYYRGLCRRPLRRAEVGGGVIHARAQA